jgi:NADH:ubiquinone oxidoreductase subunit K
MDFYFGAGELMPVSFFLVLSALLFSIGIYGVLARQHAVLVLLSIELMLNAVNINLIAFSALLQQAGVAGQVFALFVITVAAAEVGVGLAIVILIYRNRQSVDLDELSLMKW